jgi:hypothetical protein
MRKEWRVVDQGVNNQPFLWRKINESGYVMIDVFQPDTSKRCYPVLFFLEDPYSSEAKGELIGIGCANTPTETWNDAYERARKIAEEYMEEK